MRQQFDIRNLQKGRWMIEKILQVYDLLSVQNGIIILGEKRTGKSTALRALEDALNRSS